MTNQTFVLSVARQGRWWIVDAAHLDYRTQARTLAEVEEMGRDLIAGSLDIAADSFELDIRIEKPADVSEQLDEVASLEREAQSAVSRAARGRRLVARTLRDRYGLSASDAARVLGVTRARVYQLLNDEKASA